MIIQILEAIKIFLTKFIFLFLNPALYKPSGSDPDLRYKGPLYEPLAYRGRVLKQSLLFLKKWPLG